ncbi:unnamed protein product [Discosporangium mesarthrocarpum]
MCVLLVACYYDCFDYFLFSVLLTICACAMFVFLCCFFPPPHRGVTSEVCVALALTLNLTLGVTLLQNSRVEVAPAQTNPNPKPISYFATEVYTVVLTAALMLTPTLNFLAAEVHVRFGPSPSPNHDHMSYFTAEVHDMFGDSPDPNPNLMSYTV